VAPGIRFVPITQPSQIASLVPFARGIWIGHYYGLVDKSLVDYVLAKFQSFEAITKQIGQEGHLYYLVERKDGDALGYIAVVPDAGKKELFLSKFYIKAGERQKGLGRQALEYIEGLARDNGLKKIYLTVNKRNAGSIAVYERMGFAKARDVVTDIGDGFVMDDFVMVKAV
jgi:GNAT superfamily N-acetyltransferase